MNDSVPSPPDDGDDIEAYLGSANSPRWKRTAKFWAPALIVLLIALAVWVITRGSNQPDYITEDATSGKLALTVTATGSLRPTNLVEVGSEVSGRIDAIYVDVNDQVERGQILARINTDVIEDQIKQARANLESTRASVAQAQATLDVDRAQLARLVEVQRLSGGKVPSLSEMEAAEANVQRDRAGLTSARANVAAALASLSSANTNRERAVIRSPVAGVVLARQVEPGQTVAAAFNTPTLFVLAENLSTMQLRVNIDEADVGQVATGQTANFSVDAYPGRRFPAVVTRLDLASNNIATSQTSQQTQTNSVVSYEARLAVENPDGLLRPGMTATATIATQNTDTAMLVPNGALRFDPDQDLDAGANQSSFGPPDIGLAKEEKQASIGAGSRQQVYVLQTDGTLKAVEVTTGQSDGRLTVVQSSKLRPGMAVVTGIRATK